ncbi:MAG: hypothetical protein GWP19_00525 [Planctomycetia bacterium]|nr:hypothetical protein [Planctomycetia bacterium]
MIKAGCATSNRFLPSRLDNLEFWYSPFRSTITKDGSNLISQWNDISGNSNHATQVTDANKMIFGTRTLNNIDVIDSRDTAYMNMDMTVMAATNYTIYAVTQTAASGSVQYIIGNRTSATNQGLHVGYFDATTARFSQWNNDMDTTVPAVVSTESQLWKFRLDTGTGHSSTYISDNVTYTNSNVSTSTLIDGLNGNIGTGFQTTNSFKGDLADILGYSDALSTVELGWVETYLKTTWGFTL